MLRGSKRKRLAAVAALWIVGGLGPWAGRGIASEEPSLNDVLEAAESAFREKRYDVARREYERATDMDPGSIPAWLGFGWSLWQLGERDQAFRTWREVAKVRSNHPDILLALAQAHEHREEWDDALDYYGKIIEANPKRAAARMGRARVLNEIRRLADAERDLEAVLAQSPRDFDAQFLLAQIYKETGRREEAIRLFDRLARSRPDPRYLRSLADVMLELGRAAEAITHYQKNLRVNPGNRGTILGLARAHAQLHHYAQSVELLEGFLASHPDDAKIHEELARFAGYGGDFGRAERHLRILVQQHPEEVKWRMSLARTLQNAGKTEEPVRIAREVLQQDPDHEPALELLLENALFDGRRDEALLWLERLAGVSRSPKRLNQLGDLYITLGDVRRESGDDDGAEAAFARSAEAFRRAMSVDPANADAKLGVATAMRLKGDYEGAIEAAQQVLARFPNVDRARRELYESYVGLEDFDRAESLMRETLRTFPGNLRLEHELARVRFKQGARHEAIQLVEELLEDPGRRGVAVLLYHGVSEASTREDTMSVKRFRDQMQALRRDGYESISVQQLRDFLTAGAALPPKPVLITFDDARADSFRYADPVLEESGFRATMFLPVQEVGSHGPFNAVWSKVREMYESGRWDMQCHSYGGHSPIPVDAEGTLGVFLANRMWLSEPGRLETREEFTRRLEEDYRRCGEELLRRFPKLDLVGYAYPFGEMGQKSFSNEPAAVQINQELAVRYYGFGFVQDPAAAVTRRSGRAVMPRFEVPWDFTGEKLLRHLQSIDPYASSMLLRADLYAWDGRFADANAVFDEVARYEGVDRADLLTRRGRVHMWQGDFAQAKKLLATAEKLHPGDRLVQESVSGLQMRLSPSAQADALLYADNRDRTNLSVGPSGKAFLTERVSVAASYRYKQFVNDDFDASEAPGDTAQADSDEGAVSTDSSSLASRVDLRAVGNEVQAELAYNLDWRTGLWVSGGVAQFQNDSSGHALDGEPDPFPLGAVGFHLGFAESADVLLRATRGYVGAAGAILDDLGASGAEGRVEIRPFSWTTFDTRYTFYRYDDGNLRHTGVAKALRQLVQRPLTIKAGYRFTYDDARDVSPFFYTPSQYLGNDGIVEVGFEPVEGWSLNGEAALGVGQERGGTSQVQASIGAASRVQLGDRFSLYASGGRSQAANFNSFQASGGFSLIF